MSPNYMSTIVPVNTDTLRDSCQYTIHCMLYSLQQQLLSFAEAAEEGLVPTLSHLPDMLQSDKVYRSLLCYLEQNANITPLNYINNVSSYSEIIGSKVCDKGIKYHE